MVFLAVLIITQKDFEVRKGNRREGDPAVLVAKADKANKELNWIPKFSSIENIIQSAFDISKKINSNK